MHKHLMRTKPAIQETVVILLSLALLRPCFHEVKTLLSTLFPTIKAILAGDVQTFSLNNLSDLVGLIVCSFGLIFVAWFLLTAVTILLIRGLNFLYGHEHYLVRRMTLAVTRAGAPILRNTLMGLLTTGIATSFTVSSAHATNTSDNLEWGPQTVAEKNITSLPKVTTPKLPVITNSVPGEKSASSPQVRTPDNQSDDNFTWGFSEQRTAPERKRIENDDGSSSSAQTTPSTTTPSRTTPPQSRSSTKPPAPKTTAPHATSRSETSSTAPEKSYTETPATDQTIYTVEPGDSLWTITQNLLGPDATNVRIAQTWPDLYRNNQDVVGPNPNLIYPGQVFTISTLEP